MDRAIDVLKIQKDMVDNNEPINRSLGDIEQVNLEREVSNSCSKAISLLNLIKSDKLSDGLCKVLVA